MRRVVTDGAAAGPAQCVAAWLRESTPGAGRLRSYGYDELERLTSTVSAGNPTAFRYGAVSYRVGRVGRVGRAGIRCRQQPIAFDRQTQESLHLTPTD